MTASSARAAGFVALLREREQVGGQRVGTVLCGGNADSAVLAEVLGRG